MSFELTNEVTKTKLKGFQALVASALAFSLMTVFVKKIDGRIPVAEIVFIRSVISLLITRVMLKRHEINPWGENKKLLLLRGLLGTGALFCIFQALFFLPLATATVIQYTYPTFTALFAKYFLGETLKRRILLAIMIGWIGIILVLEPLKERALEQSSQPFAISIAISGAILTALAYVSVRKLTQTEAPLVVVHYFPLVSVPICLPFLITGGVIPQGIEWLWLVGIGVFTQLGQVFITTGLQILPAGQASSINYTQVLFATLWGILFFSESLNPFIVAGGLCVFGATLITLSARSD